MSRSVSDLRDDLEDRVAALTKEVRTLRKSAARRGHDAYDDVRDGASELFDEVWTQVQRSLPLFRKQAYRAGRSIRDNPGTSTAAAVVGVGLIALLASLLLSRRGD